MVLVGAFLGDHSLDQDTKFVSVAKALGLYEVED
jgi:hypothetical protein